MSQANSRRMKRKLVSAANTPKCTSYLMKQHRDSERFRHRELNESINEVVRRVPGFQTFSKHSKIVRLQQVIDYITYLERNIETIYNRMNVNYDFRHVFMSTNFARPSIASFSWGNKQSKLSRRSRASVKNVYSRRHRQINVELSADSLTEDVADDDTEESELMIDESDVKLEHSRQSENTADLPAAAPDQSASSLEQPVSSLEQPVSSLEQPVSSMEQSATPASSVVDETKKRHVVIVVKHHLSPAQVTTGSTAYEQGGSNVAGNIRSSSGTSGDCAPRGCASIIVLQALTSDEGCGPRVRVLEQSAADCHHYAEKICVKREPV